MRGDEVRLRRRETVHEHLYRLVLRRRQEHNAPGRGELLPQRVPHAPGRHGPEEARHAIRRRRGGGGRGRAGRRERRGRREHGCSGGGGGAEGAGDDPGVAEPREGARAEEAMRAAPALALVGARSRGPARRGAEAAVHRRRLGGGAGTGWGAWTAEEIWNGARALIRL